MQKARYTHIHNNNNNNNENESHASLIICPLGYNSDLTLKGYLPLKKMFPEFTYL